MEVWKLIPGLENYEVSRLGEFRRADTGRAIAVTFSPKNGYGYVRLGYGKSWKNYRAHRLVLLAHYGPSAPGLVVRHLDGDRRNNRLTNLAWGSHSENAADKIRHGTLRGAHKGQKHHLAKLSDADIEAARDLYALGWLQKDIARRFGASQSGISRLLTGKSRQSENATKRAEMRL